jgi:HPt (histidine-containing phosphotransfer) domain-containing protein
VSSDEVLDPAVIAELRRAQDQLGSTTLISQLVEIFRQNASRKMDEMREALAAGDAAALERAAHTLMASCGMFGAARMAACCASLEAAAARADLKAAAALFADAEDEFPGVLDAVTALS